jgi:hypothetical protein
MPSPTRVPLSEASFREALDRRLGAELGELQSRFRKQRTRIAVAAVLGAGGFALGLLSFFPFLILVFLLLLYGLYLFLFNRKHRSPRVSSEADLRRLILKAVLSLTSASYRFHTHRYMPAFVFRESELFYFKPDTYQSDELMELEGEGRLELAHLLAEEKVDAFERKDRDARRFEGWLFRIFPGRKGAAADPGSLPAAYLSRYGEGQIWMAVPQSGSLYRQSLWQPGPNYANCYALYQALEHGLALAGGVGERGSSV